MATDGIVDRSSSPSRLRIVDGIARIVLGVAFVAAGGAKLAAVPALVAAFDVIGVGQWLRWTMGAIEIVGAVLVFLPRTALPGSLLLACIMIGAAFTNVVVMAESPLPALVLLSLCLLVAGLRIRGVR